MVAIELFIRRATLTAHCTETNKVFSQREGRSGEEMLFSFDTKTISQQRAEQGSKNYNCLLTWQRRPSSPRHDNSKHLTI